MTEIYKVGEYVKIVLTDDTYNDELGDQTGLVGTVASGGSSVYVTFPHTGDKRFYYLQSEVVRAPGTTPITEPLEVGDWVKVVNYIGSWNGVVAKIRKFDGTGAEVFNDDYPRGLFFSLKNLEKTEKPAAKVKFAVGDWVEVDNYHEQWNGTKGQVTLVGDYESRGDTYSVVIKTVGSAPASTGGFDQKYLKPTTEPFVPKFAVGDWVEVTGWSSHSNGEKLQVAKVPADRFAHYRFEGKDSSFGFSEKYLKATDAPHWTDTKPVGATAQITYSGGGANRVIVKTADDNWLHIYQDGDGKATVTANRSNARTRSLFGNTRNIAWTVTE